MSTNPRDYLDPRWIESYREYLPVAREWWARHPGIKSGYGLEASTLRAYSTGRRGAAHGPAALFNEWARVQLATLAAWPRDAGADQFEELHRRLGETLRAYWQARVLQVEGAIGHQQGKRPRVHRELSVGQVFKMVDLFVRHLWLNAGDKQPAQADHVWRYGHSPLDRKSLHVLSATFSGILLAPKFSMGMIVSDQQYAWCQSLIRIVCQEAGGSPLLFDRFAWDSKDANALYGKRKKGAS